MKSFNVIVFNFNEKKFEPYDIIPYLYKTAIEKNPTDIKEFIKDEALYKWWSRCEYEIIISDWPPSGYEEKWDVYDQVMMNINIIADIINEILDR